MALDFPPSPRDFLAFRSSRTLAIAIIPLLLTLSYALRKKPRRSFKVPKNEERVLVLGASSGIGRSVARQYAARGARVCIVGRRESMLREVEAECRAARTAAGFPVSSPSDIFSVAADFASPDDMVRVRKAVEDAWGGLDTHVIAAGVSALQPLMAVAGAEVGRGIPLKDPTTKDIQHTANVALAAIRGNYLGPLIAAVAFVPMLSNTSKSPSVVLVNSLASVIPAPTRTLYASTKASSLVLYQALSIEHPSIRFTFLMPSTVEGNFRASAVDSGPVREKDPNAHGLKREDVARRCIQAVDNEEKAVFVPEAMRYAHLLYWIVPSFIEKMASKKYGFST
ncbi:hypothetical protein HYPSUDRAFT_166479 [Hypholoma sublateritium FD-334 SS-4]|uniref:NAD(P)-binding protein n=1 Tax=Hypholoma sublateritium (strain FD-334 SS-4) TaxID=945553 RepID=A0A0D2PLW1_HYPSF|nr:hypothetical protein HYPSUDRAFT_166479 [Hypholoma sublateritium FD-334 SS-4]